MLLVASESLVPPIVLRHSERDVIEKCDWPVHQSDSPFGSRGCFHRVFSRILHITTRCIFPSGIFCPLFCLSGIARLRMCGCFACHAWASANNLSGANFRYDILALLVLSGVVWCMLFVAPRRIPSIPLFRIQWTVPLSFLITVIHILQSKTFFLLT